MGNWTSCKVRIIQVDSEIDIDLLSDKIEQIKVQNNISNTIEVYIQVDKEWAEIRFGGKHASIDEIFESKYYDVWFIGSDEGGASDVIKYYPSDNSAIGAVNEKAIFKFDKIKLYGDIKEIEHNLVSIFGSYIVNVGRILREDVLCLNISGLYTSNNYFYCPDKNEINFIEVSNVPFANCDNSRTEFSEFIWDNHGIQFMDKFYKEVLGQPNGLNIFPYLNKIEFEFNNFVTNIIQWETGRRWHCWEHKSLNDFFNLANSNYKIFEFLSKNKFR
jgi:hypothetical protein